MDSNLIENILHYAWPPVILLSILWTILAAIFLFVRYQLKKENTEKMPDSKINDLEKEKFIKEIDQLAIYVSKLQRPENIIKEFRKEERENGD